MGSVWYYASICGNELRRKLQIAERFKEYKHQKQLDNDKAVNIISGLINNFYGEFALPPKWEPEINSWHILFIQVFTVIFGYLSNCFQLKFRN